MTVATVRTLTTALLMPALAVRSVRARPDLSRELVAAQCLSWAGDLALSRRDRRAFLAGLTSFLLAHVAYVKAYRLRSGAPLLGNAVSRCIVTGGVPLAAGMSVAAGRRDRAMALPVAAYGATIAVMAASAAAVDGHRGRDRLLVGSALFVASDTLIGVREFLLPGRTGLLDPPVMATYAAAQWCLAVGLGPGSCSTGADAVSETVSPGAAARKSRRSLRDLLNQRCPTGG